MIDSTHTLVECARVQIGDYIKFYGRKPEELMYEQKQVRPRVGSARLDLAAVAWHQPVSCLLAFTYSW